MSSLQGTKDSWLNDPTRMPTLEPLQPWTRKPGSVFYGWKYGELKHPIFMQWFGGHPTETSFLKWMFQVSSPNVSDFRDILASTIGKSETGLRVLRYPAPLKKWIHSKRLQGKKHQKQSSNAVFFSFVLSIALKENPFSRAGRWKMFQTLNCFGLR